MVVATVSLVVLLAVRPLSTSRALGIWVVIVTGLALLLLVRPSRSPGRRVSPFEEALRATVDWYRDNRWWWEKIKSGEYSEYYQRQYGQREALSK